MRTFVVRFALAAAVLACSDATSGSFGDLTALHQHEAQWNHRDFHSYTFNLREQHFGDVFYLRVTVLADTVASFINDSAGVTSIGTIAPPTVDELFAIARSDLDSKGLDVRVEYDSQLGYPTLVYAYNHGPAGAFEATVSNLHPVQ